MKILLMMILFCAGLGSLTPVMAEPVPSGIAPAASAGVGNPQESSANALSEITDKLDFAKGLMARNLYDMALSEYRALIRKFPADPQIAKAYFGEAEACFFSGNYAEALGQYQSFRIRFSRDSQIETVRQREAECLYRLGRKQEAGAALENLSKSSAGDVQNIACYYRAKIAFEDKRWAEAEALFKKIDLPTPDNPFWEFANYYLGEITLSNQTYDRAMAYFLKATETQKPDLKQAALAGMGKTSFARGDFVKALEYFKTAYQLKVDPKASEDVLSNLLKSAYNLQDYKQLLDIYQKEQATLVTPQKSAEIRLIVAGAYALTKDYANANRVFDEILRNPDSTDEQKQRAVLGKVQNLILLGHADEALIILNEIPRGNSMFKDQLLYLLGEASMREGKSADALKAFDALIRDFPESRYYFEAFLIRGYVNLDMGKVNEARQIFHDFVKKFPDYSAASKALADAITLDVKMEDWKKGIEDSELYLRHYPAGELAQKIHYRLASFYSESGDYAKADAVYEEHVKKYAGMLEPDISFYRGYNRQLAGKFADAVAQYQKLDPAEIPADLHFSALKNSAYCYVRLEKFDEAAAQYRQIIAENPANDLKPEVYFWLADYYVKKQDAPSVGAVLESFKLKPEAKEHPAELEYYLGEGLRIGKDYPGALQHYEAVIRRGDVFKANALYGKGLCSLELKDYAAAIAAFEDAVKAAKDDHGLGIRVRMDLAGAYARKGDMLEAAKAYFAVAILYDDPRIVPDAFFKAGDAFEKAGKAKEAAQAYRELVERYGKDPRAAEAKIRLAKIPQ